MNNGPQTKVIEGGDYMSAQVVGLRADTMQVYVHTPIKECSHFL